MIHPDDIPEDREDEEEIVICPHCGGLYDVPCYCGGDLCVCENHGDKTCPVCGGLGDVIGETYDRYMARQAEMKSLRKVLGDALK